MSSGQQRLFLPWVRRGLAGAITTSVPEKPNDPAQPMPIPRAELAVSFDLAVGRDTASATTGSRGRDLAVDGLQIMGPGDVAGLGSDTVAKIEPPDGARDMAPNLCPSVEFHAADLPWQFTPGAPDGAQRLTPWLMLVCVEDETEGQLTVTDEGTQVLTVTSPNDRDLLGTHGVLPDLSEVWAWAHVQVTGVAPEGQSTSDSIAALLDREPHRAKARIICPRNLTPVTSYICALVPVFEVGRLTGLGRDDAPDRIYAWDADTAGPLDLPVYHHWRFATAVAGDFEALARRLSAQSLAQDVGTRPVDIQRPGFGTPTETVVNRAPASRDGSKVGAPDQPFPLTATALERMTEIGGALRPAGVAPPDDDPLTDDFAVILDKTRAPDGRPLVTPPVYGSWHAGIGASGLPAQAPSWLAELSTRTRHRIAAGIGAEVVAQHKDALMADIWEQYSAVTQINGVLERARLARAAGRVFYHKHLEIGTEICGAKEAVDAYDRLAPVLDRVLTNGLTVGERLDQDGSRPASPAQRRAERNAPAPKTGSKIDIRRARTVRLLRPQDPRPNDDLPPLSPEAQADLADLQVPNSFALPDTPDWKAINAALCSELDPAHTQKRRAYARLGSGVSAEIPDRANDPLHPVVAAPRLRRAVAKDLRALSQDWMLPGLDRVPENAVSLLEPDRGFIEAVMAGANHALNAEMLWRGFPTDRTATVLTTFWEGSGPDGDIADMTDWRGALGDHPVQGGRAPTLMLVIRGDLLKRFPETMIYAAPANGDLQSGLSVKNGSVRLPLFRGSLDPDVTFLAFDLTPQEVAATDRQGGWFFMVEGPPTQPKFGLDETLDYDKGVDAVREMNTLAAFDWDPTYWGDLLDPETPDADLETALNDLRHIAVRTPANPSLLLPADDGQRTVQWGANAAHMAAICLQRDTRLALHANALFGGVGA